MKDMTKYIRCRSKLTHTAEALQRGKITIGYIGGSITEPEHGKRWSDKVTDWFVSEHPGLIVNEENAALGATGSLSHVFRMDEDILPCGCDLVFVETVVNDGPDAYGACREGILRKLLRAGTCDVVLVYAYGWGMFDDFSAGKLPAGALDYEELGDHYRLSSVSSGLYAFDRVAAGAMRWEEWLPDTLHPEHAGSRVYAEPIIELLERAAADETLPEAPAGLPEPLHTDCWEHTCMLPWDQIERHGPWRLVRHRRMPTVDYMLYTASPKASVSFSFEGRGLLIRIYMHINMAGFRFRIDGGEWETRETGPFPNWMQASNAWPSQDLLASNLPTGLHRVEIACAPKEGSHGSNLYICTVGIIQ